MTLETRLIITRDGSHTLFVPSLNEHYHSIHGAITESQYIFIEQGFMFHPGEQVSILEIGFGTGLNALLTCMAARKSNRKVHYIALEKYPLEMNRVMELNYPDILHTPKEELLRLHTAGWNKEEVMDKSFVLKKIQADWTSYIPDKKFDVVYYDAFAPAYQPEMWSYELMEKTCHIMAPGGVLTTYTVKGDVRRGLSRAGFQLEKLKGPGGGKREMLRAINRC